jgi:hypothetical protein
MHALKTMAAHGSAATVHRSSIEKYLRIFPADRNQCESAIRDGRLRIIEDMPLEAGPCQIQTT